MISELSLELQGYVEGLVDVEDRYYQVMDLDDMQGKLDVEGKRIAVGIVYGGTQTTSRDHGSKDLQVRSVAMIDCTFHIVVSYWYDSEDSQDTKAKAFGLLDLIRGKVLGKQSSIALRPWEFVNEKPLEYQDEAGTIYYMQTWKVRASQSSEQT